MSKYLDDVGVKYLWNKTTNYVDNAVNALGEKMVSVYHFKGSVNDLSALKALQEDTLTVGDVYNVKDSGMNYVWTGEKGEYDEGWDALGGMVEIPTLSTSDIDELLRDE